MGVKAALSKPFAQYIVRKIDSWSKHPVATQQYQLSSLIKNARPTAFGKDHGFDKVNSYEEFKKRVPLRDYEGLRAYIDQVIKGRPDVLWKGVPLYFSKTSGTTSGAKFIPISKESISHHINSARNALLSYIHETGNTSFIDGKMMFLQGSPELKKQNGISVGRLSGIVAHHVPAYLQRNRIPSMKTNCIEDWDKKVDAIVEESLSKDMRLISGIPPWVQMYFERILERTGKKTIIDVFPNFSLFAHGGVNFEPYKATFDRLIGKSVDTIETYPASEGFIAYQDSQREEGLLLGLNSGIFYEFVRASDISSESPERVMISDVEIGVNYAIILNTNAGLWGYILGDTIRFVSKTPFRIVVTGRIKHFISAFGEHVIAEEVERALQKSASKFNIEVKEFHVAPQVNPKGGELPYHEWFVEFKDKVDNLGPFQEELDRQLQAQNSYYKDLIVGRVLQPLKISIVPSNGFVDCMRTLGKLGGQNKAPRLANDRSLADHLSTD